MKSKYYREGFEVGRKGAEGFHKNTMNARERQSLTISPYDKIKETAKRVEWVRGRLDGAEDYWKDKEHIDIFI